MGRSSSHAVPKWCGTGIVVSRFLACTAAMRCMYPHASRFLRKLRRVTRTNCCIFRLWRTAAWWHYIMMMTEWRAEGGILLTDVVARLSPQKSSFFLCSKTHRQVLSLLSSLFFLALNQEVQKLPTPPGWSGNDCKQLLRSNKRQRSGVGKR